MIPSPTCPDCGAPLPPDGPRGLCPSCLLGAALSRPGDESAGVAPRTATFSPTGSLAALAETLDGLPRVLLRDTEGASGVDALVQPASTEMPPLPDRSARLQLLGEIARGGMGAILKGRDVDLGRDLAVKVLLEKHRDRPELIRRFVEEAQIAGQLQHPGIVPVYELGAFADRRPYFSMKLVKGRTLAAVLAGRGDPAEGRMDLLATLLQVAQTVAFAHARGVIHRDLKPSNVMVGSFGEVQVMDWGLAKVLPKGGAADDEGAGRDGGGETVIATVRSGSDADHSHAGSVLGTPAYMAPEQARGEVDRVDERADVFALGSILCEVLTGRPAFVGRTPGEIQRTAALGDLADAFARLDACGADAELVALAKGCLARERDDRPRDASAVVERLGGYLASIEQRLRAAELECAAEAARAEEARARVAVERSRRRRTMALAASLLALTTLGGLTFTYVLQQRQARRATADRVVGEVKTLLDVASSEPEAVARWEGVLAAVHQAEEAIGPGVDPEALRRLATLGRDARAGADAARRDRTLLDAVAEVRSSKQDLGLAGADDAYARAFRAAGLDVDATPAEAGARLKARPAAVVSAAAAALDDWALVRRADKSKDARWRRPLAAARAADPDPFRDKVRAALLDADAAGREAALRALAADPKAAGLPPASSVLLAQSLTDAGAAVALLRVAAGRHPDDAWVNYTLAERLGALRPAPREEQVRYYSAARAVRPDSAHELAHLLDDTGRTDEALAVFADLVARRPDDRRHFGCYGRSLRDHGRPEAAGLLARAVAAGRAAIRLKPDDALAHSNLGVALRDQGKLDEAAAELRAAIRLKPDYAEAHCNLGGVLRRQGDYAGSLVEFRTGHELGSKRPGWPYPSAQWVQEAERQAALAERLPAVIRGEVHPRDNLERLSFAQMGYDTKRFAAAARLWAEALESDPRLADDRRAGHRYNAACAAALAAAGQGKDDPPPDDAAKARLRAQALDWLKAERDAWAKVLDADPKGRPLVVQTLQHWKADPDLAGVRDARALESLPEAERADWRALWAEVDRLRERAGK